MTFMKLQNVNMRTFFLPDVYSSNIRFEYVAKKLICV